MRIVSANYSTLGSADEIEDLLLLGTVCETCFDLCAGVGDIQALEIKGIVDVTDIADNVK